MSINADVFGVDQAFLKWLRRASYAELMRVKKLSQAYWKVVAIDREQKRRRNAPPATT